jgi:8-oxo-dGTP diphosphatase
MTSYDLEQSTAAEIIYEIVANISAFDSIEERHIQDTLIWIDSGVPIFRIAKPNIPNKHLVSYFVLFDREAKKILLVDHKNAKLWLPTGGHVEIDESPKDAVKRECIEELGIIADFWHEEPIFLTSTVTVGLTAGHTDVSLWYVLNGNSQQTYKFDVNEFNAINWFGFNEIPYDKTDMHMRRFISKLQGILNAKS